MPANTGKGVAKGSGVKSNERRDNKINSSRPTVPHGGRPGKNPRSVKDTSSHSSNAMNEAFQDLKAQAQALGDVKNDIKQDAVLDIREAVAEAVEAMKNDVPPEPVTPPPPKPELSARQLLEQQIENDAVFNAKELSLNLVQNLSALEFKSGNHVFNLFKEKPKKPTFWNYLKDVVSTDASNPESKQKLSLLDVVFQRQYKPADRKSVV